MAKAGRGEESVVGAMAGAFGGRSRTCGVAQAPSIRSDIKGRRDLNLQERAPLECAKWAMTAIVILSAGAVKGQTPPAHPPAASPPAPKPTAAGPRTPISLADAVFIGLRDNRTVKSAYINRVSEKFDLFVARTRYQPTATIDADFEATRQAGVAGSSLSVTPTVSWLIPTGAEFQVSWSTLQMRGPRPERRDQHPVGERHAAVAERRGLRGQQRTRSRSPNCRSGSISSP